MNSILPCQNASRLASKRVRPAGRIGWRDIVQHASASSVLTLEENRRICSVARRRQDGIERPAQRIGSIRRWPSDVSLLGFVECSTAGRWPRHRHHGSVHVIIAPPARCLQRFNRQQPWRQEPPRPRHDNRLVNPAFPPPQVKFTLDTWQNRPTPDLSQPTLSRYLKECRSIRLHPSR